MANQSRRYQEALERVDGDRRYTIEEAVEVLKSFPDMRFDETIEVVMNLGIDPRHADQQLRGTLSLPHGTGKEVTVLVFAEGQQADDALAAGAEYVGSADLAKKIEGGWADFDLCIATPAMMRVV